MVISTSQLNDWESAAEDLCKGLGVSYQPFTSDELGIFGTSFERQFIVAMKQREIVDAYIRHAAEILAGGLVMKDQVSGVFDGERPAASRFGIVWPRAAFFGIGYDWDSMPTMSAAPTLTNWIHSGTTFLAQTVGNPIKMGKNAVHVVIGIDSLSPNPSIEAIQFTIDGKPKPITITNWPFQVSDFHFKEFDVGFLLKKGTTVLVKTISRTASVDIPHLFGASYVPEDILRLLDPTNLPGTTYDYVLTT